MGSKGVIPVFIVFLVAFTPTSYSQNPQEAVPVENKSNLKRILRFFGIGGTINGNQQVNPQFHQFNPCALPTTTPSPNGPMCPYPFPGQYQPFVGQQFDPNFLSNPNQPFYPLQPGGYPSVGPPFTPNQPGYIAPHPIDPNQPGNPNLIGPPFTPNQPGNPNLIGPPFTPNQPNYPPNLRPLNPNDPNGLKPDVGGNDEPVFLPNPNRNPPFIPNPKYNQGPDFPFIRNPIPGAEPPYIVNPKVNLGPVPPFIPNPALGNQYPFILNPNFNVGPVPAFIPNKDGQIIPNPAYKNSGPEPTFIPNMLPDGTLGVPPFLRNPKVPGPDTEQPFLPNPALKGQPIYVPNPNFNKDPNRAFVPNPSGQPAFIPNPTFNKHPNELSPNGQNPNGQLPNGQRPNGQRPNGQNPNGPGDIDEPVFIPNPKGDPAFIPNPKYNQGPDFPFIRNPFPGAEPPYFINPNINLGPVPPFIPNPALGNQNPFILNPNLNVGPVPAFIPNKDGQIIPNPAFKNSGPEPTFIPNILPDGSRGQPPFLRNPKVVGAGTDQPFLPNPVLKGQPLYVPNPNFNKDPNRAFVPNPSGQPAFIPNPTFKKHPNELSPNGQNPNGQLPNKQNPNGQNQNGLNPNGNPQDDEPVFIRNPKGQPPFIPNPKYNDGPNPPFIRNPVPGAEPPFVTNPMFNLGPIPPFIPNPLLGNRSPYVLNPNVMQGSDPPFIRNQDGLPIPNPKLSQLPEPPFIPNVLPGGVLGHPPFLKNPDYRGPPMEQPFLPNPLLQGQSPFIPNPGFNKEPNRVFVPNPSAPPSFIPIIRDSSGSKPNGYKPNPAPKPPSEQDRPDKPRPNNDQPVNADPNHKLHPGDKPLVVNPLDPTHVNQPVVVHPTDPLNPNVPVAVNPENPLNPNVPVAVNPENPNQPMPVHPVNPNDPKPINPHDPSKPPLNPNQSGPNTGNPQVPPYGGPYVPLPPPNHPDISGQPFPLPGPFADPASHPNPLSRPLPCSVLRTFTPNGYSPVTLNSTMYSALCPFLNPSVRNEPACSTLDSLERLGATKFRDLIVSAGLKQLFEQTDGYTVFAPLDIAFNRLPNWLITSLNTDHKLRQAFVLNHFVKIDVPISNMDNEDLVPNARPGKNYIRINVYHPDTPYPIYSADGARLLRGDILSSKGRIHLTDKAIMPNPPRNAAEYLSEKVEFEDFWNMVKNLDLSVFQSDRPVTVFIPVSGGCPGINKNILLGDHEKLKNFRDYHVVNRTIYSAGVIHSEFVTTNYEKEIKLGVASDGFSKHLSSINSHVRFLKTDIPLVNGVAHVIDSCISEKSPFYGFEDSDEFEMEFGVISRRSMKVYGEEKELLF